MTSFEIFNQYLKSLGKLYKDATILYVIAWYNLSEFIGITQYISDNYEEIKKIYDDNYAWKPNQVGVTEYSYKIIEIDLKEVE